jgi:hypothetical protein
MQMRMQGMVVVANLGIEMVILKRMQLVITLGAAGGVCGSGGDDSGKALGVGVSEDLVCRYGRHKLLGCL